MNEDLLMIGEALIDVVRRPGQPEQALPGGCSMNVAVALGRLGCRPYLATRVGKDQYGQIIAVHCGASGVQLLPGYDRAPRTAVAEATIDAAGKATYTFDLDWRLPPIPANFQPGLIHTGSLGALLADGGPDVLAHIEAVRRRTFIAFDPNCRPAVMGAGTRDLVERYVAAADLVKASDEDLTWLYPSANTDEKLLARARIWAARGPAVVVVTMGSRGAVAVTRDQRVVRVAADTTRGLADTVGAGDSFMAGLIHGLTTCDYSLLDAKTRLGQDLDELARILAHASRLAGIAVSRPGANPPWAYELTGDRAR
jgi:fructokinase